MKRYEDFNRLANQNKTIEQQAFEMIVGEILDEIEESHFTIHTWPKYKIEFERIVNVGMKYERYIKMKEFLNEEIPNSEER